jgi:glycosyltransferase involved in cell wall biosynthesis
VIWTLASVAFVLAAVPAALFWANLRLYRTPPFVTPPQTLPRVSLLIPARNEEIVLRSAVESALGSTGVDLEVLVLDDHSEDATAKIVSDLAAHDPRLRLLTAPPLPSDWCGKQHACAVLARAASHPLLAFLDADVRLRPDGLARLSAFLDASGADLVSGIPQQETGTWLERLVIPLIPFLLLGFLPLGRMRQSRHPAYAAGCGQLFLTRRDAYQHMGGHAAIRASRHDGIMLPRAYRRAGLKTDLCDLTDLAVCRMYRDAAALWHGLAKNAVEGLARPFLLIPATLILFGGQVLPILLLPLTPILGWPAFLLVAAIVLLYSPRLLGIRRFRQPAGGIWLHPLGILLLLLIQWYGFFRWLLGRPVGWKGRPYPARAERTAGRR